MDESIAKHATFSIYINDDTFFKSVPYNCVTKMKSRNDVKNDMNVKFNAFNSYDTTDDDGNDLNIYFYCYDVICVFDEDYDDSSDCDEENVDDSDLACYISLVKEDFTINYSYDTHYDCYCKTRTVCGCDPKHVGW